MTDKDYELFQEAVEKGIWKGIEKIGKENLKYVPWFSILAEENEKKLKLSENTSV